MGAILALIRSALAKAPASLLTVGATKLAPVVGSKVPATADGIFSSVKRWIGQNPGKAAIAVSILAPLGFDLAVKAARQAFSSDGVDDDPVVQGVLSEMEAQLKSQRQRFTGDGNADTVHGIEVTEYEASIERFNVIRAVIGEAASYAGNLNALESIRKAVFLEDADFEMYRRFAD